MDQEQSVASLKDDFAWCLADALAPARYGNKRHATILFEAGGTQKDNI